MSMVRIDYLGTCEELGFSTDSYAWWRPFYRWTFSDGEKEYGFIENLVVFYLENSGHKITLYTKRWFALANHFFLCYNIFRYFSIFGGFLLTLNQYLL